MPPSPAPDLDPVLARAREAQARWGLVPVRRRAAALRRFRRLLVERLDEVVDVVRAETGKPRFEAMGHEGMNVLNAVRFYERRAPRVLSRRRVSTGVVLTKWGHKQYDPLGVVAVISPWNFPFMLPALPAVAALAGGNAVVFKPSEIAPRSGQLLGDLLAAAVPEYPGLVQVVQGDGVVGDALVRSGVDKVAFIGGGPAGRKVLRAAAESLTPVLLELGGNDAAIVCHDADVERAAAGIAWGALANAGQCCIGIERVLVATAVYDRFVTALKAEVARVRVGVGEEADVSRLTFAPQRAVLDRLVEDATARGADVIRYPVPPGPEADRCYPPTVLLGVTPDMEVNRTEAFGPIVSVLKVRDEDEAVAINNAGPYGLSPSIWTRSRGRAHRLADQLHAGLITINDHLVGFSLAGLPYGGVKESGYGRLMGDEGLLEFVRVKSVAGARLTLRREPYWFPYSPSHARALRRLLRVWFTPGLGGKIRALFRGGGSSESSDLPGPGAGRGSAA